jgi:hypothetical protein
MSCGEAPRREVLLGPADLPPPPIVLTEYVSQPLQCSVFGIDVVSELFSKHELLALTIVAGPTHEAGTV